MAYGRQWLRFNPASKKHYALPPKPDRSVTSNQLIGRMAHMAARMLSNRPTFSVLGQNDTPDARRAAWIGEKVLEHDWSELKLFQHRYYSILHMILFGYGAIKYWWDPHAGEVVAKRRLHRLPSGATIEDTAKEYEYAGAIKVLSVSPAEILVPPGLYWPDLSLSPWLTHQTLLTPEEIHLRYGVEVLPEENDPTGFSESLATDVERFTYFNHGSSNYRRVGRVKVNEYYERPSPQKGFERGKVLTTCQGKILAEEDSQLSDGRYPFAMFAGMPEPGKFVPHAWMSDMNQPQVSYNEMLSRLNTWFGLAFYPKILNPKSAGIPDHWFRSGGFEILPYEDMSGAKPEWWSPTPPPGQAFSALNHFKGDMDSIGSQFGFARGEPQSGSPSGALAQVMIEADSTELGPLITQHAREWEGLGRGLLELHRRFDPAEKLIVLTGASGAEVLSYKKTDIPVNLRVQVQEDSLQPRIKAARKQELQNVLATGLYGNPPSPRTRLKLAEWAGHPTADMAKDSEMLEFALIEAENLKLVELGEEVQVAPTDDHEAHIAGHRERTLLKDRFEWGPIEQSPVWQRMLAHIGEHQAALDEAAAKQAEMEAQTLQKQVEAQNAVAKTDYDLKLRNELASKGGEAILAADKELQEPPSGDSGKGEGDASLS